MKHMVEMGIRALKQNASAVVAHAVAGETVTITSRGHAVAQLSAIPATSLDRMLSVGTARPPRRDARTLPNPGSGAPLSDVLAAMRDDERD